MTCHITGKVKGQSFKPSYHERLLSRKKGLHMDVKPTGADRLQPIKQVYLHAPHAAIELYMT